MFITKITNAQKTFNYGEKKCFLGKGDFFFIGPYPTRVVWVSSPFFGGRISVFFERVGECPTLL